ncbi:MAG: SpvB/TcaC N-terminal domain-containing protein [Candidatus Omnitrophota bacterium]
MPNSKSRTITEKRFLFAGLVLFFCLFYSLLYAEDTKPTVGGVSPQFGTSKVGVPITFSATFTHPNGWQHIKAAYFIISTNFEQKYCPYFYFDLKENKLYIRNDAGTSWLGGYPSGNINRIENSYAQIDCYGTNFQGQGNTLTVNWRITFKKDFAAPWNNNLFLYAVDDSGVSSDWKKVEGGRFVSLNQPPQVGSLIPSSGLFQPGKEQTFTVSYSDANGLEDLYHTALIIEDPLDKAKSICLYYFQRTDKLYFQQRKKWYGGYKPGSSNSFESQYAKLDCSKSKVRISGNTIELGLAITFKDAFSDSNAKNIYLDALDMSNASAGRIKKGTCVVGTIIGIEGGEIASADKSVRLVIPKDALSQPTAITLNNVLNQDFIKTAAPERNIIIAAVECKPDGLKFNKPVSLIFNLPKAEIPATVVGLGFCEAGKKIFSSTGQTTLVSADNYTVKFSSAITHFSYYAALIGPQGAPIGTGVKIPLPDMLTGSFSHSLPIAIAPGRKGMQPGLAFTYRSSNPNSWTGVGFGLNPGYIVRSTRLGPPRYVDELDSFYFITDAGSTELVHLVDNLYEAKIESSFSKFYKENDDSWRVLSKDGSEVIVGKTPESREGSALGTFAWNITKTKDTNGNYMQFIYVKDDGKSYLARIDYTGNEAVQSPKNSVEFLLEPREDVFSSYLSGGRIATAKRLKEIQAKSDSELVWRYELGYGTSNDTGRSLLKSITQFTADGKPFPEQKFKYQKSSP